MKLLKFIMKDHKHFILERDTILIRRFGYYRRLYEETKDEWIGDPQDGESSLRFDLDTKGRRATPYERAIAARNGIDIDETSIGTRVENFQSRAIYQNDYVFCVAKGDPGTLKKAMYCASAANPTPYDACLEIKDDKRLLRLLEKSGTFTDAESGVCCTMRWSDFRQVVYSDQPLSGWDRRHAPLQKRKKYQEQAEWRSIFSPTERSPTSGDTLKVHAPGLGDCFRDISAD
jgi:hypothetical protein